MYYYRSLSYYTFFLPLSTVLRTHLNFSCTPGLILFFYFCYLDVSFPITYWPPWVYYQYYLHSLPYLPRLPQGESPRCSTYQFGLVFRVKSIFFTCIFTVPFIITNALCYHKYFPSKECKHVSLGINIFGTKSHFTAQRSNIDRLSIYNITIEYS